VIARHTQKVADTACRAAEHIGLERDPVAVLARHLHDWFQPKLPDDDRRAKGRHAPEATLIIGKIDCVDCRAHPLGEPLDSAARRALWRRKLARNDNLAGPEAALKYAISWHYRSHL
jgi:hypothetical protein